MPLLASASPLYAFQHSEVFGQIICLFLVFCSTVAWSILVEKWFYFRLLQKQTDAFKAVFQPNQGPLALFLKLSSTEGPCRTIATQALDTLAGIYQLPREGLLGEFRLNRIPRILTAGEIARVEAAISAAVDDEIIRMEARMGLLSTVVSASPFLGLLGTVWGVMITFVGMADQGKVDVAAIAPGISAALVTTVVGLLVAIPAIVGFNFLTTGLRVLTVQLDNFAAMLHTLVRCHLETPPPPLPPAPPPPPKAPAP